MTSDKRQKTNLKKLKCLDKTTNFILQGEYDGCRALQRAGGDSSGDVPAVLIVLSFTANLVYLEQNITQKLHHQSNMHICSLTQH